MVYERCGFSMNYKNGTRPINEELCALQRKIACSKVLHQVEIEKIAELIKEHIKVYRDLPCDYLHGLRERHNYHRGAWNALNEIEK